MTDLARALGALASTIPDDAGAERMVGQVTRMTAVVRRRRAVRRTGHLAVGAGIAGAVVLTGAPLHPWGAGPDARPAAPTGPLADDGPGPVDPSWLDAARKGGAGQVRTSLG